MNETIAAIFDMDGVLADTYHAHYACWHKLGESVGIEYGPASFIANFGRTSREIIAQCWEIQGDSRIVEMCREKEDAFRRIIADDFPAMPGAVELLGDLHSSGFRLAIGSSAPPENVEMIVARLGVGNLLDAIVTGSDVTRGKPDPQVFLLAAERMGVAPSRCVVVEDAPAGVEAALAAGMAAVGMASTGRTVEELAAADIVIRSLGELNPARLLALIEKRL